MTRVDAMSTTHATVAKGGVQPSLYSGRSIEVVKGFDVDPTQKRGYRRAFMGERSTRPGAYTPRTTRVGVRSQAPSTVGTTMVLGGIDALNERNAKFGVAGSRAPFASHCPKHSGHRDRVSMLQTPAYPVLETAYARTGVPVLYSKFAAPAGQVPNGMTRFDPIPAYTRVPLGSIVQAPTPVGCLPGTPGCFAEPGGSYAGLRKAWWLTQNEGQLSSPLMPMHLAPILSAPSEGGSPLYDPHNPDSFGGMVLPILHPGMVHTTNSTTGQPSYVEETSYPAAGSPWGSAGGTRPAATEAPMPSGHDQPLRDYEAATNRGRTIVAGAIAVGLALVLMGRR